MNARQGVVAGVAALALLVILLFPPYLAMDSTSGGTVHAAVGHHPVWAPPTQAHALAVLARDPDLGDAGILLENLDIRVNRVRLLSQVIGLVLVALVGLRVAHT